MKVKTELNESRLASQFSPKADAYREKFKKEIEALENTPLAKSGLMEEYDIVVVGEQLELFQGMLEVCEAQGNTSQLGVLPKIALDLIVAQYGSSVLSLISTTQTLAEETGRVYYREIIYEDTKGNMTAGDVGTAPHTPPKTPKAYAGSKITAEVVETGDGSTTSFSGTLTKIAKSETARFYVSASVYCIDVGDGTLLGAGVSGTIDYETGDYTLEFAAAPANLASVYCDYHENYELAGDLPIIGSRITSKSVQAQVHALKTTIGQLQSFAFQKRWNQSLESLASMELMSELNKELVGLAILELLAATAANGSTTIQFDKTAPSGVAEFHHREAFKYKIAELDSELAKISGQGKVKLMICGRDLAAYMESLPGFVASMNSDIAGPQVYGTYKGIIVIRVAEQALLDKDTGLCLYKGRNPWESPVVYAPYMPITSTGILPISPNPLTNQNAVASWSAIESLVGQYVVKLQLIAS